MPNIIVDENNISKRGSKLQYILNPLRGNLPFSWQRLQISSNQIIYSIREKPTTIDYSDWRINTFHNNFKANYKEVWLNLEGTRWWLQKCYLNIYYLSKRLNSEDEYVCLHADPLEDEYEHKIYKQAFHIHIIQSQQPIPHSHIALGYQFIDHYYKDDKIFFDHFKKGIELIVDEILKPIPEENYF